MEEIPLLSPNHKSSSLILTPPANRRVTLNRAVDYELKHSRKLDPNMDIKKLRRTISNRLSAQRSKLKKVQYINHMEKKVKDLEEMVSVLTQQIEGHKERVKILLLQHDSLKELLELRSIESRLSEIELQMKRDEISRLKELQEPPSKKFKHLSPLQYTSLGSAAVQSGPTTAPNSGSEKPRKDDQQPTGSATRLLVPLLTPKQEPKGQV